MSIKECFFFGDAHAMGVTAGYSQQVRGHRSPFIIINPEILYSLTLQYGLLIRYNDSEISLNYRVKLAGIN